MAGNERKTVGRELLPLPAGLGRRVTHFDFLQLSVSVRDW
jgi:hypothetical protein